MLGVKQTLSLELLTVLTSSDLHGTKRILHAHKFKAVSRAQNLLRNIHETVLSLVSYHIYMWSRIEIGGARSCITICVRYFSSPATKSHQVTLFILLIQGRQKT